jgi:hypothetical protein
MLEWNIISTSATGRDRDLPQALNQFGDFRRPGFRGSSSDAWRMSAASSRLCGKPASKG